MSDREAREAEQKLAGDYLKGAVLARTVSHEALELALQQIRDGSIKDPARTALNAATASGILLDKRLILEGRPTQIHAVDPAGALNALARKVGLTIEGTATELPPEPKALETRNGSPKEAVPTKPKRRATRRSIRGPAAAGSPPQSS
jgi:hypothetical protein